MVEAAGAAAGARAHVGLEPHILYIYYGDMYLVYIK
jgi:hypothetical protein